MQTIALWCGIAGLISSVLAVIIVVLIRKNIVDIIDKDVILFDGNFNTKKDAITSAFDLLDHISSKGKQITNNPEFAQKARQCYNNLICVVSNIKVAKEFYNIALNTNSDLYENQIENFKLLCRKDIGLKTEKIRKLNNINSNSSN